MIRFLAFCAAVATFAACNDWTEMETVDSKVEKPWEQDPALWAEYTAALRLSLIHISEPTRPY